jgi:DNA-binding response OmpR family regulator
VAEASRLRIVVVEDDPAMAALLTRLLGAAGHQDISVVASGAAALARAATTDLVLLDHQLPDVTGIELLPRLLARPDPPSVVMVTGAGNETLAAAALRAGAEDYVAKDGQLRDLLPQIVERVRRVRALRAAQTAVEQELVRAERLAAIGEMMVTLHHEINNPLMVASAEVELLAADRALSGPQRASVAAIRTSLDRVRDIMRRASELRQAESQDYLAGLRMINLRAADPTSQTHRGRALLWIAEEEVARLTALVLRHSGFSVERVASSRELETGVARPDVTLVVLSTVGGTDATESLGGFRPAADRRYGLVALVAGDPTGARAAGADRAVSLPFDPATLADELGAAVNGRSA